jgi:hypothetical protein
MLAAALLVRAGGVHDQPLGRLVPFGDVRAPGELQPHRAHPDRHLALVLSVAEILGELGARQARGHLRDVAEELPDLLDRFSDLELVPDQHRVSFFTYAPGSCSNAWRQPAPQK